MQRFEVSSWKIEYYLFLKNGGSYYNMKKQSVLRVLNLMSQRLLSYYHLESRTKNLWKTCPSRLQVKIFGGYKYQITYLQKTSIDLHCVLSAEISTAS